MMTVAAVAMVKDEQDVIESIVSHMIEQVDHVLVADNLSTDSTREILDGLDVTVIEDNDPGYYQSRKMTALAHRARELFDAEWIVPFDADEWWESTVHEARIGDQLAEVTDPRAIVPARVFDHVSTALDNTEELDPIRRIQWLRPEPLSLPKVACRWHSHLEIGQGNHIVNYGDAPIGTIVSDALQVHHFPYRSEEQFVQKAMNGAAAYAATDLLEGMGAHWRLYGKVGEEQGAAALEDWYRDAFYSEDPESDGLKLCPVMLP